MSLGHPCKAPGISVLQNLSNSPFTLSLSHSTDRQLEIPAGQQKLLSA